MDSHGTNMYPINTNKDNEIFGSYVRNPCAQQTTSQRQHFLPAYAMPSMSSNISQSLMYNTHQNQSVYNIMYPHQQMYRNQNSFTTNFTQSMDWSDPCMKPNDKYLNEKKKENCCVDNITTDVYKTKNFYNYNKNTIIDPQWYYGNCDGQKYSELPSCSQITDNSMNSCCDIKNTKNIKSVKYCSIQKLPETDQKLFAYPKQYDNNPYVNQYNKLSKEYPSCSQLTQTCNLYSGSTCLEIDKKILQCEVPNVCDVQNVCDVISNQYYPPAENTIPPYIDVPKILNKSDDTNGNGGESDIVVEDSDEDTDVSEETEKEELLPCIVCNLNDTNFYDISSETTVTSFSHTKVSEKLFQLLGWISHTTKNICSVCMGLLNTLDNLEMQLETVKQDLLEKYKGTPKLEAKNNTTNFVIPQEKQIKRTKRKTLKSLVFKCKICQKIFSLKMFYKYHMAKHKSNRKSFLCIHCGSSFSKRIKLRLHLKQHQKCSKIINSNDQRDQNIRQFICHICGKIFKSKTNLKDHENICSGILPHSCSNCDKKFPSSSKLNQHIRLYHQKKYTDQCKICGKGFIKKSDYNSHIVTHSNDRQFLCKICGRIYKSLSNLNHHKKIHNEKLPFVCAVCQKGFLRKVQLEAHLNSHNGLKPFSCTICEKKFGSQKNLDAHIKVHNGTAKKKTCNICGKHLVHGLEEHMRIHSNLKAFECVECCMKFLTKGALAKHNKRKHESKELDVLQI